MRPKTWPRNATFEIYNSTNIRPAQRLAGGEGWSGREILPGGAVPAAEIELPRRVVDGGEAGFGSARRHGDGEARDVASGAVLVQDAAGIHAHHVCAELHKYFGKARDESRPVAAVDLDDVAHVREITRVAGERKGAHPDLRLLEAAQAAQAFLHLFHCDARGKLGDAGEFAGAPKHGEGCVREI